MCALQFGINVPEFSRLVADEVNYIVNEVLTGNAPYKEVDLIRENFNPLATRRMTQLITCPMCAKLFFVHLLIVELF